MMSCMVVHDHDAVLLLDIRGNFLEELEDTFRVGFPTDDVLEFRPAV